MIKKALIISFSGIDGAGKSTQVKLLSQYLKSKNKKFLATEEMFTYFLVKPIIGILRSTTDSPKGGPVTINKSVLPKLWFIVAFVDIWIGYLFNIVPKLFKYDYVIADRFYTDIWANLLYYGYIPKWGFEFFLKLLPTTDIPLIFVVKPKTVRKREDDFPIEYYKKQSIIYAKLARMINCHILDANRKPENVFLDIKSYLNE